MIRNPTYFSVQERRLKNDEESEDFKGNVRVNREGVHYYREISFFNKSIIGERRVESLGLVDNYLNFEESEALIKLKLQYSHISNYPVIFELNRKNREKFLNILRDECFRRFLELIDRYQIDICGMREEVVCQFDLEEGIIKEVVIDCKKFIGNSEDGVVFSFQCDKSQKIIIMGNIVFEEFLLNETEEGYNYYDVQIGVGPFSEGCQEKSVEINCKGAWQFGRNEDCFGYNYLLLNEVRIILVMNLNVINKQSIFGLRKNFEDKIDEIDENIAEVEETSERKVRFQDNEAIEGLKNSILGIENILEKSESEYDAMNVLCIRQNLKALKILITKLTEALEDGEMGIYEILHHQVREEFQKVVELIKILIM